MAELNGKRIRLSRLTEAGKMVCVPMDHGVTSGPIRGLVKVHEAIRKAEEGGA
ncbi:MAG: fructose-bisphosphate aldolase, partial [Thermoproteota archaeon]